MTNDMAFYALFSLIVVVVIPMALIVFLLQHFSKEGPKKHRGVLLATFLFLVILSFFAASNASKMDTKSSQSEALFNLKLIYKLQVAYHQRHVAYAGGHDAFSILNWEPKGFNRYAYFCGDDYIEPLILV